MAKIGLTNFRYAVLTEALDGTPSYDGAKTPAKAISCNVEITNNEATLYADDVLAESDTSFQSGTVTMGIDDEDIQTMAALLGHTVTEGEMTRNAGDTAPYVGFGRVVTKLVNGAYKYKVEFLYKVKFAEPSQEDTTKGESVEFNTTEVEGTVSALANGNWSVAKTFDTKTAAITYLEAKLAAETVTITYDANDGTGSIPDTVAAKNASIILPSGAGLTKSGYQFTGWATTSSAETANATSPYTAAENATLYAVWEANA